MKQVKSGGFTIIELSFVFIISSFILVTMMIGISFAVERQRFKDSTVSTQNYIQSQYQQVTNTINNRPNNRECKVGDLPSATRGNNECIILGRALQFEDIDGETHIRSYAVIAHGDIVAASGRKTLELLIDRGLYIIGDPTSDDEFIIPWGVTLDNRREDGGGDLDVIAILRSPINGSINLYKITPSSEPLLESKPGDPAEWTSRELSSTEIAYLNTDFEACFRSSGAFTTPSALIIQPVGSVDGVNVVFDSLAEDAGACV